MLVFEIKEIVYLFIQVSLLSKLLKAAKNYFIIKLFFKIFLKFGFPSIRRFIKIDTKLKKKFQNFFQNFLKLSLSIPKIVMFLQI